MKMPLDKHGRFQYLGPVREYLIGDKASAAAHHGEAASLLDQVKNYMKFRGLVAHQTKRRLSDGTIIIASICYGQGTVVIHSPLPGGGYPELQRSHELVDWYFKSDIPCYTGDCGTFFSNDASMVIPVFKGQYIVRPLEPLPIALTTEFPVGTDWSATVTRGDVNGCKWGEISTSDVEKLRWWGLIPDADPYVNIITIPKAFSRYTFALGLYLNKYRYNISTEALTVLTTGYEHALVVDTSLFSWIVDPLYKQKLFYLTNTFTSPPTSGPPLLTAGYIIPTGDRSFRYFMGGDFQKKVEDDTVYMGTGAIPQGVGGMNRLKSFKYPVVPGGPYLESWLATTAQSDYDGGDNVFIKDTAVLHGRMFAAIFGSITDGQLYDTIGGNPYYKMSASIVVEGTQLEDDGTFTSFSEEIASGIFSPADNNYGVFKATYNTPSRYFMPGGYELNAGPKNLVIVSRDRCFGVQGYEDKTASNILFAMKKNGPTWQKVYAPGICANVIKYAEDGSGFISRDWYMRGGDDRSGQLFWTDSGFVPSEDEDLEPLLPAPIPECFTYTVNAYSIPDGQFNTVLTIKPADYPCQSYIKRGFYYIYHSDNLEVLVITGSLNTDGIWSRNPATGEYVRVNSEQNMYEPVFLAPDGTCVATRTKIYMINRVLNIAELVAEPNRCCGVFFDYQHYMDMLEDGSIVIKRMELDPMNMTNDDIVIDTLPLDYNFFELAPDSSFAIVFRIYTTYPSGHPNYVEPENVDKRVVRVMIVDFADGPPKFETSDRFLSVEMKYEDYLSPDALQFGWPADGGIPYGRRNSIYLRNYINPGIWVFLQLYVAPKWGFSGYWAAHLSRSYGADAWRYQDTLTIKDNLTRDEYCLGISAPLWGWDSGHNISIPYQDAFYRRRHGLVDENTRITSHMWSSRLGIMERLTNNMGPVPESIKTVLGSKKVDRQRPKR